MEKKIGDYLHLYLGCEVMVNDPEEPNPVRMVAVNTESIFIDPGCDYPHEEVKLVLRPLSDMSEDEEYEYYKQRGTGWTTDWEKQMKHDAAGAKYLLSNSFDIFGLIESGIAIDKTKNL